MQKKKEEESITNKKTADLTVDAYTGAPGVFLACSLLHQVIITPNVFFL